MFPRPLRDRERELLEYVLPEGRPGYTMYREHLAAMVALGEGRRGAGNLVLGYPGSALDRDSALPPVMAYGMLETFREQYSITVREETGDQIDVEIVSSHQEELPDQFEEKRRWTYSLWLPGLPSPCSGEPVREVQVSDSVIFAIAAGEKRLWAHHRDTGVNHLIPVTNFYNELMIARHIRDPKTALDSSLLFTEPDRHADQDLRAAFIAYNAWKHRFDIPPDPVPPRVSAWKALTGRLHR